MDSSIHAMQLSLLLSFISECRLTKFPEYNKCLAASQPNPDFTGCSATKDTCMTGATYDYNMASRAKRDGKFGRLLL